MINRRGFLALSPAFPVAAVTGSLTIKEDGHAPVDLDVSVLKLQPGDTLVMHAHIPLPHETVARLKARLGELFPGVTAMVLDHDLTLEGVIRGL